MKTKKHRNRNLPNPVARGFPPAYEPSFKRSVILYAEQKSNQEARKRFGISEETIKRWRKLRQDIMEKAEQCIRRSQRHAMGHGSFSESGAPAVGRKEKEKSIEKEKGIEDMFEDDPKKDLDSMPLQQRLSQNHNESSSTIQIQESQLHSLPISPTKLKVTRQGKPQPHPARLPTPPPPAPPQVCLKWNSHHTNMQAAFPTLLTNEQYVDVTLVSEGKTLKCHRMILSSCSPYFEEVLNGISPFQHPVLFMKDIPFWALKALCDFMYAGEVHILQDKLQELLNVATSLKIKGLAGPPDSNEDTTPAVPEIKQEIDHTPSPKIVEKAVKEEKEEESLLPLKVLRHDSARFSKKKEDRKSRHITQSPKEKEKVHEESPSPPPKSAVKIPPKIVTKAPPAAKTTVKNVLRNAVKAVPKASTSKITHTSRKSEASRRNEKHKIESVLKEKEKEKEKLPLKKGNINDPLDLLQPVYEEIAKEETPHSKSVSPSKMKERGNVPVRKGMTRRVRKRRYADYVEDRDESPPPLFQSRKGTRSRPNVKIPKYFHTHFDDSPKETVDATIVREPHTDQNDPLIGVEVEEIKAEPLDVEENTIEMEENLVNFVVPDPELISQEGEEIIGNYDSPLVNIKIEPKRNTPNIFKKVLDPQSVLMDIHSASEANVRLLEIKEENVQFVDISRISTGDSQIDSNTFSQMESPRENQSEIIISSVQSMADLSEENRLRERDKHLKSELTQVDMESPLPKCVEIEAPLYENQNKANDNLKTYAGVGVKPLESLTSQQSSFIDQEEPQLNHISSSLPPTEDDPLAQTTESHLQGKDILNDLSERLESDKNPMEIDSPLLHMRIENVRSEKSQISNDVPSSSEAFEQCGISSGSLGSLEAKVEALGIECESSLRLNNNSQCNMVITTERPEINSESSVITDIPENAKDKSETFKISDETQGVEIGKVNSNQPGDNSNLSNLESNIHFNNDGKDTNSSGEVDITRLRIGIEASEDSIVESDISSKIVLQKVENEEVFLQSENIEYFEDVNKSNAEILLENESEAREVEILKSPCDVTKLSVETGNSVNVQSKKDGLKEMFSDLTSNIEAELEQCLASTSPIAPSSSKLNLVDEEDFTKDIEFESFGSQDKASNDLGSELPPDLNFTEIPKAEDASISAQGDSLAIILEGDEKRRTEGEEVNKKQESATENIVKIESSNPRKEKSSEKTFNEQEDTSYIEQNIVDQKLLSTAELKLHCAAKIEQPLEHAKMEEETEKYPIIDRLLPENEIVKVNSTDHHTFSEEEQRMEETLLADLDDDIMMKDATTSQDDDDDDDGSEKTLEMIVNDLNESLGEMRK